MSSVVVDTDVFSFFFKRDSRSNLYEPHLKGQTLHLAFVSVAELYRWAVQHSWGQARIDDLQNAIGAYNVLGYDEPTAWEWARATSVKGRPVAAGDAWIPARR